MTIWELLARIGQVNEQARRERPRRSWDPPRSRTEVKRRYIWDFDVPFVPPTRTDGRGINGAPAFVFDRAAGMPLQIDLWKLPTRPTR